MTKINENKYSLTFEAGDKLVVSILYILKKKKKKKIFFLNLFLPIQKTLEFPI